MSADCLPWISEIITAVPTVLSTLKVYCCLWLVNRFRTGRGPRCANLHKRGLTQSPSCDCCQRQTANHIVDTCALTKLWRWTESTPWSGWWCSHMAGIYSDCSTRDTEWIVKWHFWLTASLQLNCTAVVMDVDNDGSVQASAGSMAADRECSVIYTVSQKKTRHLTLAHNFTKYLLIF